MVKELETMESHYDDCASNYDQHSINELGRNEFYDEIERQMSACKNPKHILVLGCGTGLEIERIKQDAIVTAIDCSNEMLKKLKQKTLSDNVKLRVIHNSFHEVMFTNEKFDLILSTFALHYSKKEQKAKLYENIYRWLKPNGYFINGDLTAKTQEMETQTLEEAETIYKESDVPFGTLHVDTPLCLATEQELLKAAGFTEVSTPRSWSDSLLIKAEKVVKKAVVEEATEV